MIPEKPNPDADQMNLLSIFHYIVGGLVMLMACMFLSVIVMGMDALEQGDISHRRGWIVIVIGSAGILLGWILAILIMWTGYDIARRRRRGFTLAINVFNLLLFPFGTLLAICTFVVLRRNSIRLLYSPDSPGAT